MSEKNLTDIFKEMDKAPINPQAKQRAIAEAMRAFAEQADESQAQNEQPQKNSRKRQGFWRWLRPTGNNNDNGRRTTMSNINMKWTYGLASFACVLMLAVFIGLKPGSRVADGPVLPDLVQEPKPAATPLASSDQDKKQDNEAAEAETSVRQEQDLANAVTTPSKEKSDERKRMAEVRQQALESLKVSTQPASAPSLADATIHESLSMSAAPAKRELYSKGMAPASMPAYDMVMPPPREEGRDRFEHVEDNPVKLVKQEPVSTFSIDVDTSSYSFVRRQLNQGRLPQKDAIRIEEMINYFDYQYPVPKSKEVPFSTSVVVSDSPWKKGNKLVHIGIKGYEIDRAQQPKSNLVFLLDVSGSMASEDKLPLVKQSMSLLLDQLHAEDTVAIVVYAGAAGTVLEPTPVKQKQKILDAMNNLQAGGSTAGAQGIELAYQLAENNFNKNAVNRIILATDGDFNVGITNREELKGYVERKREKGIFLSVLGFGQGNYHDHMMQTLAQNGNGIAAYIDTLSEAQKVLVEEATSSLFPIAKDVKIQVEFNPATVAEYRLIGYETRKLNREDFNNDKVDAGDIGAGHTVTAIYEITPVDARSKLIDDSRYADKSKTEDSKASEYGFVKLRYKLPKEDTSKLISQSIEARNTPFKDDALLQRETRFATAVAGFAQLLKGGKYLSEWNYDDALQLALENRGSDDYGYRNEFVQLVRKAKIAK